MRELQQRYAELSAQRRSVEHDLETLVTDQRHSMNPGLLDLLPTGRISADVSDQVLRQVFELSRLEIHFDKRTHQARYQVTLHPETIKALSGMLAGIVVPLEDHPSGRGRPGTPKSRLRERAEVRKPTDGSVTLHGILTVTATLDLG